jgi:hypothetical protein
LAVSGWGLINWHVYPKFLQTITIPVVKRPACTKAWQAFFPKLVIKIQHLCAGTNSKGGCKVNS